MAGKAAALFLLLFLGLFLSHTFAGQLVVQKNGTTYTINWDNAAYTTDANGFLTSPGSWDWTLTSITGYDTTKTYMVLQAAYQGNHCYWIQGDHWGKTWYSYQVSNTEGLLVALLEANDSTFLYQQSPISNLGISPDGGPTQSDTGGYTRTSYDDNFLFSGLVDTTLIWLPWSQVFGNTQNIDFGSTGNPTITIDTNPNGSASASPTSGPKNTAATLSATPAVGYSFSYWTINNNGGGWISATNTNPAIFVFGSANATVTANFSRASALTGSASALKLGINPDDVRGNALEPIDTGTGAHTINHSLLRLHGAQDMDFTIDYNSIARFANVLGVGWSHNYEAWLTPLTNGNIQLNWNAKKFNVFVPQTGNTNTLKCTDLPVFFDTLMLNNDSSYTLQEPSQRRFQFDSAGRLMQIVNPHGQPILLLYQSTNPYPSQIQEAISGKSFYLAYNSSNQLIQVSNTIGQNVTFTYDASNNLTQITKSFSTTTNIYSFSYDLTGRVLSETDPENRVIFRDSYDSMDRVIMQQDALYQTNYLFYDESQTNLIITTVIGRTGATNIYVHNSQYELLSITDPLGKKTSCGYDTNGNQIAIANALGQVQRFAYDSAGNLIFATDAAGKTTTSLYDSSNNMTNVVNALSNSAAFTYDANNNLIESVDFLTNQVLLAYDTNSQLRQTTSPRGGITTFTVNNGLPASITDAATNTTGMAYDAVGRLIAVTNAAGFVSTNAYDINDNLIATADGSGNLWRYTYDSAGRKLSAIDPQGNTTWFAYNGNGDLVIQTNALGQATTFTYDAEDRLLTTTDANGHIRSMAYDAAGRLISVADTLNHTNSFQYDAVGNLIATVDALGITNQITAYDARNQPILTLDALGNSKRISYDALQRLIQTVDALNRTNTLNYDALSHLTSTVDPLALVCQQQFDSDGNRTTVVNPKSAKFGFQYDLANRLISSKTATGRTTGYTLDARNLVTGIMQASGAQTALAYDGTGRLTNSQDLAGNIAYTYDAKGRLLVTSEYGQTITRQYDALDRLTNYTDAAGNVLQYTYDGVGNLTCLTYPDGKTVDYSYDSANRLINILDWAGRITTFAYDADNRPTRTTLPNGTVSQRSYDIAGRLQQQQDITANSSLICQVFYIYDAAGQITSEAKFPVSAAFQAPTVSMSFDADNALIAYTGQAVTNDANGNMIYGPLTNGFAGYTYDVRNRLTGAGGVSYAYDPAGNRVAVTNGATVTQFVVNPNAALSQVLMRIQSGVTNYYVYGAGLLYEVAQTATTTNVLVHHYDYRGSTVAMTDGGGNVTDRVSYSPYGGITSRTGTNDTPFMFNGNYGVQTDANGLLYMRARYYNTAICRFVNPDPSGFKGGKNLYAHAYGNPVSLLDPFGLCAQSSSQDNGWHSFSPDTGSHEYYSYNGKDWTGYLQAGFLDAGSIWGNAWDYFFAHHIEIGATAMTMGWGNGRLAFESVSTPFGEAFQSANANAMLARSQVESGVTLYRIGTMGKSAAGEAQFWALENPLNPGFAERYGIPAENVANADFIETAILKPGASFVTRVAPKAPGAAAALGKRGIETVVSSGNVQLNTFNILPFR